MKGKKPAELIRSDVSQEPITPVIDSTGLTTTTKGAYIEDKWRKEKRKFLKLHILADKKTGRIAGFRVTSEHTGDSKKFVPLIKDASKKNKIQKVYGDTAYDARENINLLDEIKIEPAIKIRKNARTLARGSPLRREETVLMKKLGLEGWKKLKDYGQRWMAEIVFSSFKRMLGEVLHSKKFVCQKAEASLKVMLYNKFISV